VRNSRDNLLSQERVCALKEKWLSVDMTSLSPRRIRELPSFLHGNVTDENV
jgi:hypothetical protein